MHLDHLTRQLLCARTFRQIEKRVKWGKSNIHSFLRHLVLMTSKKNPWWGQNHTITPGLDSRKQVWMHQCGTVKGWRRGMFPTTAQRGQVPWLPSESRCGNRPLSIIVASTGGERCYVIKQELSCFWSSDASTLDIPCHPILTATNALHCPSTDTVLLFDQQFLEKRQEVDTRVQSSPREFPSPVLHKLLLPISYHLQDAS